MAESCYIFRSSRSLYILHRLLVSSFLLIGARFVFDGKDTSFEVFTILDNANNHKMVLILTFSLDSYTH